MPPSPSGRARAAVPQALHKPLGTTAPLRPVQNGWPMQFISSAARLACFALASLILSATPMPSRATEEPAHDVEQTLGPGIELRRYAPYVVAEVVVPGPAEQAGSQAFSTLLGYISGQNKGAKKLAMTAPVTQAAAPAKLEMTAPVTQAATAGGFAVQFVLPRGTTLATAPEPTDPRVQLREVPAARVAVIRYSGFWSASNDAEHLAALRAALATAGLAGAGEPVYARYDPPFKPWFMRRNEIWLPLR
jgi:SOUL heme-binding protein